MQENNDHTFAKSLILVGKVTGDKVLFRSLGTGDEFHLIFNDQSIDLLAINETRLDGTSSERLWKLSDIFRYYWSPTKNPDTLRIKMSRL